MFPFSKPWLVIKPTDQITQKVIRGGSAEVPTPYPSFIPFLLQKRFPFSKPSIAKLYRFLLYRFYYRKGSPLVNLLLPNCTPFTYLV